MKTRCLGKEKFQVSASGLGYIRMGFAYSDAEEPQAINMIHAAVDMGMTFLDSTEVYGPFDSEVLVGEVIKGIRDKVWIATKLGFHILSTGQGLECMVGVGSRSRHIRESMEGLPKRPNIETIDLLYQHRVDPAVPMEDVVDIVADLVKEGKTRHIGLSRVSAQTLRRACRVYPITAMQTEYSLWTREPEADILSAYRELGMSFVPYSPLGHDSLTGKITDPGVFAEDDFHCSLPHFQAETMRKNQLLSERLQQVATRYGATLAQIALAWVMDKGEDIVPILEARKIAYLRGNVGAANIILSPENVLTIEDIFTPNSVIDLRYNQGDLNLIEK